MRPGLLLLLSLCWATNALNLNAVSKLRGGSFRWDARETGELFGIEEPTEVVVDVKKKVFVAIYKRVRRLFTRTCPEPVDKSAHEVELDYEPVTPQPS